VADTVNGNHGDSGKNFRDDHPGNLPERIFPSFETHHFSLLKYNHAGRLSTGQKRCGQPAQKREVAHNDYVLMGFQNFLLHRARPTLRLAALTERIPACNKLEEGNLVGAASRFSPTCRAKFQLHKTGYA